MVIYIAVAIAAILLVLVVGFVVIARASRLDLARLCDVDYGEPPDEPWHEQFEPAGDADLPFAIRLSGDAYRWHSADRLHKGAEFYRMFEDGPWKWSAQGRFAGKEINCGHYFGLSVGAATEEASHYGIDPEKSALVHIAFEPVKLLDLTHPEFIRTMFQNCVQNHEIVSHSYYVMLSELIELGNGGNSVTDYLGYRARKDGYQGILFFSARTMEELQIWRHDLDLEAYTYGMTFSGLRAGREHLNVVFFSGADLIVNIRTLRIGDSEPFENPYCGQDPAAIDGLFEYGSDYQESKSRFTLSPPTYQRAQ